MLMPVKPMVIAAACLVWPALTFAQTQTVAMEVTAYCDCGDCNGYKRGSWKFLKLDQWNRYVSGGSSKGSKYTGKTASGGNLVEPRAGLFTRESVSKPMSVPGKIIMPWRAKQRMGTIAADTDYYPFGTRMYVPGWGWGVVGDRGSAIKGPQRIDIFFTSHGETDHWGRQTLNVNVEYAGANQ